MVSAGLMHSVASNPASQQCWERLLLCCPHSHGVLSLVRLQSGAAMFPCLRMDCL
jgi:hypothetical protein